MSILWVTAVLTAFVLTVGCAQMFADLGRPFESLVTSAFSLVLAELLVSRDIASSAELDLGFIMKLLFLATAMAVFMQGAIFTSYLELRLRSAPFASEEPADEPDPSRIAVLKQISELQEELESSGYPLWSPTLDKLEVAALEQYAASLQKALQAVRQKPIGS